MKMVNIEQRKENLKMLFGVLGVSGYLGFMIGFAGTGNPIGYYMAIGLLAMICIGVIFFGK